MSKFFFFKDRFCFNIQNKIQKESATSDISLHPALDRRTCLAWRYVFKKPVLHHPNNNVIEVNV